MLQERYGGWLHRRTADAFASYAEHVARRLGDRIAWWLTINEPWCIATQGYAVGTHPPYLHDETTVLQVAHHLLLAHGLAVPRIRQHSKPEGSPSVSHLSIPPIRAPRPSRR